MLHKSSFSDCEKTWCEISDLESVASKYPKPVPKLKTTGKKCFLWTLGRMILSDLCEWITHVGTAVQCCRTVSYEACFIFQAFFLINQFFIFFSWFSTNIGGVHRLFTVRLPNIFYHPQNNFLLFVFDADSCRNRCHAAYNATNPCQCNDACVIYNNCCQDFFQTCSRNGPCIKARKHSAPLVWLLSRLLFCSLPSFSSWYSFQ